MTTPRNIELVRNVIVGNIDNKLVVKRSLCNIFFFPTIQGKQTVYKDSILRDLYNVYENRPCSF